jgi:GTPase
LGPVLLADTVGFIRHLPHKLVQAFRATLEQVAEADLLLHVVDCAAEERDINIQHVVDVLSEIDAETIPRLDVFNKIDLAGVAPRIDRDEHGRPQRVWVSAAQRQGLDLLLQAIGELLCGDVVRADVVLGNQFGRLRARLYEAEAVVAESHREDGSAVLSIRMPASDFQRLVSSEQLDPQELLAQR